MIVLGEVERRRVEDLGGDRAVAVRRERLADIAFDASAALRCAGVVT